MSLHLETFQIPLERFVFLSKDRNTETLAFYRETGTETELKQ